MKGRIEVNNRTESGKYTYSSDEGDEAGEGEDFGVHVRNSLLKDYILISNFQT